MMTPKQQKELEARLFALEDEVQLVRGIMSGSQSIPKGVSFNDCLGTLGVAARMVENKVEEIRRNG